ncbi:Guanylate kinase/L-type calcium channel beta subunit [Moorella glycerini]|uniref:Guanylate kinase n=2 Tax=Neomoorella stamsii TaxID=1266720 RepID=A0A9X7J3Z3_9FIRM|nr:Guanylate kinase [Moorella stamsii]CEP69129.1 Guanylate kinase/L-type calcium channel beta subunit [Moorella glycerini]
MVRELIKDLVVNFQVEDKRNRKGFFFVVSGPSGVGKNTLLNYALERVRGIYYLPSITTRPMRPGEAQGFPYFFISKAYFEAMIAQGAFLEWKQIHSGDYYGTHLPTIVYALENGYDIITDMDVLGCVEVMERFPENVVPIFIAPPSMEELRQRLAGREKDAGVIARRMERVDMEMGYVDRYRHVIVNDDLERAGKELVRILEQYSQSGTKK